MGRPPFITSEEIEKTLKVGHTYIMRHRRAFGAIRLGHRTWRFPPDAVERYLHACKQEETRLRDTVPVRQEDPEPPPDQPLYLSDKRRGRKGRSGNPDQISIDRDPRITAILARLDGKKLSRSKSPLAPGSPGRLGTQMKRKDYLEEDWPMPRNGPICRWKPSR